MKKPTVKVFVELDGKMYESYVKDESVLNEAEKCIEKDEDPSCFLASFIGYAYYELGTDKLCNEKSFLDKGLSDMPPGIALLVRQIYEIGGGKWEQLDNEARKALGKHVSEKAEEYGLEVADSRIGNAIQYIKLT